MYIILVYVDIIRVRSHNDYQSLYLASEQCICDSLAARTFEPKRELVWKGKRDGKFSSSDLPLGTYYESQCNFSILSLVELYGPPGNDRYILRKQSHTLTIIMCWNPYYVDKNLYHVHINCEYVHKPMSCQHDMGYHNIIHI